MWSKKPQHLHLRLLLISIIILFLVIFPNLPILHHCFEKGKKPWVQEDAFSVPCKMCSHLAVLKAAGGREFPLRFHQQRLLKSNCWNPPLPHRCCLSSPSSSSFTKFGLLPAPSQPCTSAGSPRQAWRKPPFGHFQWLLLSWSEHATLGSFFTWRVHQQKVIPWSYWSPHLRLSSTCRVSGRHARLGFAGAKAHLINYIQLGHHFPMASSHETKVRSCYQRYLFRPVLRDFVTQCQWPGIPTLGLLLCVFSSTPRKFPFSAEDSRTTRRWYIN